MKNDYFWDMFQDDSWHLKPFLLLWQKLQWVTWYLQKLSTQWNVWIVVKYSEAISSIMANLEMGKNIQCENFLPFDMDIWIFFYKKQGKVQMAKYFYIKWRKKSYLPRNFFLHFKFGHNRRNGFKILINALPLFTHFTEFPQISQVTLCNIYFNVKVKSYFRFMYLKLEWTKITFHTVWKSRNISGHNTSPFFLHVVLIM